MDINELYKKENISTSVERRKILIKNMKSLISDKKDCFSCPGHCCTYQNNSMQVTPIEALDAYKYLSDNDLISNELVENIKDSIKKYRLDIEIPTRNGKSLRRYYTCPFFKTNTEGKGCGLSLEDKPYGCLGFNPQEISVVEQGHCGSDQAILEKRLELSNDEMNYNKVLKDTLGIYWDKRNLPWAILNLIEKFQHKY